MHYMLTGEKGIGKSTVVKKVLQELGVPFGGFCTTFGDCRHERDRLLCMHRADRPAEIGEASAVAVFSGDVGRALPERFDELGSRFLKESAGFAKIIVMDELGGLERNALGFWDAVNSTLKGDIPVLGVLHKGFPGRTEEIATLDGVRVITVTAENRDSLPGTLAAQIRLDKRVG